MITENNLEENTDPLKHRQQFGNLPIDNVQLQRDVNSVMDNLVADSMYGVEVSVDGRWVIFDGTVDTQDTRMALFMLVPPRDGRRHIVDRLNITYDFS